MAINERDRLNLYDRLGEVLGPDDAGTLMELLPPSGWDDIATRQLVEAHATRLRGEMAEVRGEIAEVRGEMAELRGEMGRLRTELKLDIAELGTELRSDMATMSRTLILAMFGFMLTVWLTLIFA